MQNTTERQNIAALWLRMFHAQQAGISDSVDTGFFDGSLQDVQELMGTCPPVSLEEAIDYLKVASYMLAMQKMDPDSIPAGGPVFDIVSVALSGVVEQTSEMRWK